MSSSQRVSIGEIHDMMSSLQEAEAALTEARKDEMEARRHATHCVNQVNELRKKLNEALETWKIGEEVR